MNRRLLSFLGAAMLLTTSACAGLRAVERGDWVLVTGEGGPARELITRDAHDAEVAAGRGREWHDPLNAKAPVLTDLTSPLTVRAGDFMVVRLNEGRDVELFSSEGAITTAWTPGKRVDGWSEDHAVETRESYLYVFGSKPGKAKLKLVDSTWGTHEYEVVVKARK